MAAQLDAQEFLSQWDRDIDDPKTDKHQLYAALMQRADGSLAVSWRLAKAALIMSDLKEAEGAPKDAVKGVVQEAVAHARRALEAAPRALEANKWYCAAVGRIAPFVGVKERIQFGHEFKKHADVAREVDPNDRLLHHMYGRWCYEVAGLSWMERKIAATFFDAPPESSYKEALSALLKADELRHDWIGNQLWISKTLIADKRVDEAKKWMAGGLELTPVTEEDNLSRRELVALHHKHSK